MKQKFFQKNSKVFFLILPMLFLVVFLIFPVVVEAQTGGGFSGIVNCGKSTTPGSPEAAPCTACHAVVAGKNILDYLMTILVVVAIAITFAMGIFYILSGVNVDLKKQAKEGLKAVVIGIVFMLSAWLIVSTILFYIADDGFVAGDGNFIGLTKGEGAFGLSCSLYSSAGTARLQEGTIYSNRSASGGSGGSGGGSSFGNVGVCQPGQPAGNPCSPESLGSTCFGGANVNTWSAICQAESNGNVSIPSGVDICTGDNSVVSFGLFQINISANRVGSLDCPSAFNKPYTGSDKNCRVTNRPLYDQCVAAAKTARTNIETACRLANPNATNTGPWGAARRCQISRSL